jgi:hypothetical protein
MTLAPNFNLMTQLFKVILNLFNIKINHLLEFKSEKMIPNFRQEFHFKMIALKISIKNIKNPGNLHLITLYILVKIKISNSL